MALLIPSLRKLLGLIAVVVAFSLSGDFARVPVGSCEEGSRSSGQPFEPALLAPDLPGGAHETVTELRLGDDHAFLSGVYDQAALGNHPLVPTWSFAQRADQSGFRVGSFVVRLLPLRPGARAPPQA